MNFYAITALCALLTLIVISIITYLKARDHPSSRMFYTFNTCVAFWVCGCFLESTTQSQLIAYFADIVLYTGAIYSPIIFMHLIFSLISKVAEKKRILIVGYVIATVFLLFNVFPSIRPFFIKDVVKLYDFRYIAIPNIGWYVFLFFYMVFGAYTPWVLFTTFRNSQGLPKEQIKYFIISYIVIANGGVLYFALVLGLTQLPIDNFFTIAYGIITCYAIIRYRLMDIKVAMTKAGLFLVVYAAVLGVPFYIHSVTPGYWSISLMFLFATAGPLGYRYLNTKAEKILLSEQRHYHKILMQASEGMVKEHDLNKLLKMIVYILKRVVKIKYAAIFLEDKASQIYELKAFRGLNVFNSKATFRYDDPLVSFVMNHREPFSFNEMPKDLKNAISYIPDMSLVIPAFMQDRLLGFLILSDKINHGIYSQDDIDVFVTLSNQAALAIENCLFVNEFEKSQQRLFTSEKMALVGGMADGLAHQLKNRLNQFAMAGGEMGFEIEEIITNLDTFCSNRTGLLGKLQYLKEGVSSIERNVAKTNSMIQGILNFARTERKDTLFADFSFKETVAQCVELLIIKHQLNKFPLTIDIPENDLIFGVKPQIVECLYNTLDNAYEAIHEKQQFHLSEPEKDAFVPAIKLQLTHTEKHHLITVMDNGVGMKDDDKPKVFGPFFTTKSSTKSGSGIGAYVVKRMIEENHRGRIWFTSNYLVGTTFQIELPRKYAPSSDPGNA